MHPTLRFLTRMKRSSWKLMSYRSCWRIFSLVMWYSEMHYFMKLHYSIDLTSKLSLLEKNAENKMMKKLEINQPGYVCQGCGKPIKWVHFSYLRNLVLSNFRIFNKSNMFKKKKKKKKKKMSQAIHPIDYCLICGLFFLPWWNVINTINMLSICYYVGPRVA